MLADTLFIAHGHIRTTLDLDIVVDFAEAKGLVKALSQLEYRPQVPVPLSELGDSSKRHEWITLKEAQVFTVVKDHPQHAECDIFLEEPFNFDDAYADALLQAVPNLQPIHVVDFNRLIAMKKKASRPKDLADISALEEFHRG